MIGRIRQISAWLTLTGSVAFCMAAGAAGYHQIECAKTNSMVVSDATPTATIQPTTIINITAQPDSQVVFNEEAEELPVPREVSAEERELLAKVAWYEAGNQSIVGKRLVISTVLNRVDSDTFPNSIKGVLSQSGQFSTYPFGSAKPTDECYEAVDQELRQQVNTTVLFFNNSNYIPHTEKMMKFEDHYFSTL